MKKNKSFDCVEMQRNIRNEMLEEANYDLHTLILQVRENDKKSSLYNFIINKKTS